MSDPNREPSPPDAPARLSALVSVLGLALIFAALITVGAGQAQRPERVLPLLDPAVEWLRTDGRALMVDAAARGNDLLALVSLCLAGVMAAAVVARRRQAWPVGLLTLALGLAAWGQLALVRKDATTGAMFYAAALACALLLGLLSPAPILSPSTPAPRFRRGDALWMFGLTVLGMLLRLYALPELPRMFNGEMIISMLASRTLEGLHWYVPLGITSNSTGLMHLLPQWFFYQLFGTSVYALRLAAVLFGVMVIPLFYWLGLRLGGRFAAVVATLLLISAPEQLYWSRLESTNFAPLPLLGVVAAHLGLSMVERFAFLPVFLSALWLPFGRFFYTAGAAMVFLPWLQSLHAILFVRRAWRRMWYVLPLLAIGTAMWTASLSFVGWVLRGGGPFTISNPAQHGELILRGVGEYTGLPMERLIVLQLQSVWNNLWTIISSLSFHGGFSEWYERGLAVPGVTLMVPVVVVLVAVSLAYLLGQLQRPRAFVLLAWLAIGLLPAVLSLQPTDRRYLLIFPALYLAVGVAVQGFVRLGEERGGRISGRLTALLLGATVGAATLGNLVSHFLLPIGRTGVEDLIRFSKPIFEESDTIYFDTDESWALVLAFGNADHFLEAPPCYRNVRVGEWIQVALQPSCAFTHQTYDALMPRERAEQLRAKFDPQRLTLLVDLYTPSNDMLDTLRGLFPEALQREYRAQATPSYVALTIDRSQVERLRSPEWQRAAGIESRSDLETSLLSGAQLHLVDGLPPDDHQIAIRGGFYVDKPGWYHAAIAPACSAVTLRVDDRIADGGTRPMLSGIHDFEILIRNVDECRLPLELRLRPALRPDGLPANPVAPLLVAPYATKVPRAATKPLSTYDGYLPGKIFTEIPGFVIVDFDIDASGDLILLTQEPIGALRGRRYAADGKERMNWPMEVPKQLPIWGLNVAADGTSYLAAGGPVFVYDRHGKQISHWPTSAVFTAEIAPLGDGRVLSAVPHESAIFVLDENGNLAQEWREFEGGRGKFHYPISVDVDADGTIVVLHDNDEVLIFKTPLDRFEPVYEGAFRVDYLEPPNPRRFAFDGPHRLLFPDPAAETTLIYRRDGTRLLADNAGADLTTRGYRAPYRIRTTADAVYVLDYNRQIWRLPRHGT